MNRFGRCRKRFISQAERRNAPRERKREDAAHCDGVPVKEKSVKRRFRECHSIFWESSPSLPSYIVPVLLSIQANTADLDTSVIMMTYWFLSWVSKVSLEHFFAQEIHIWIIFEISSPSRNVKWEPSGTKPFPVSKLSLCTGRDRLARRQGEFWRLDRRRAFHGW